MVSWAFVKYPQSPYVQTIVATPKMTLEYLFFILKLVVAYEAYDIVEQKVYGW